MLDISLEKFQIARKFIGQHALSTPLVRFHGSPMPQGNPIWLKAECLQPSGSFKIRGATFCVSQLSSEQKKRGIIAFSTGNHSQAVARVAETAGIPCTIVMSSIATQFKIDATRSYGAKVILSPDPSSDVGRKLAEDLAEEHGYALIPTYDHPDIITGQGTIGIEILEEIDPSAVFVPIGGGGLIAGIAMAIKKKKPSVRLIGVEAELENDAFRSFQEGRKMRMDTPSQSLADAIKIATLGEITYPIVCHYVDEIVQVNEKQIIEATLLTHEKAHLVVEPSGALALAAALVYKPPLPSNKPAVCIASGGNYPLSSLCTLLKQAGKK